MSIAVDIEALAERVVEYGPHPYLLTTSDDGRPHAVAVTVAWDGDGDGDGHRLRAGVGRRSATNVTTRPLVSLLWAPVEPGGYSLIVDGTAAVELSGTGDPADSAVTVTPTRAVLHRPAPGAATGSDCAPVTR
jgi:hypothetical protein